MMHYDGPCAGNMLYTRMRKS